MKIATIILAAGMGTRMKSNLPKVLHKIAGKPMINHVIDTAEKLSPEKTVLVVGEEFPNKENNTNIVIQKDRLGTAHAVLQAKKHLQNFDGKILVLYGDTPLITSETLQKMIDTNADVTVLGFNPDNPFGYGRLVVQNNKLEKIVEEKEANTDEQKIIFCNSGVIAIEGKHLFNLLAEVNNNNAKGEYYLTDIVEIANSKGLTCKAVEGNEDEVLGVNSRVQLAEAENILQQKLRIQAMENGTTLIAPETVFLQTDTKLGKDTIIHPFVVFGEGVTIKDGVEIKSHSNLEKCIIRNGATIGPFARIRPDTDIGENAKIGNFVEIKKSNIDAGAKISHLSYIGDATVGKNANIGAGTITCNYNGKNKFKTEIGCGAFIGSNTALVAPVKVGDYAFIGAGSTINKDVSEKALATSRTKQKEIKGWNKN